MARRSASIHVLVLSDPRFLIWFYAWARENASWGYDRIAGAMGNLGHHISCQTVGNILRRSGIAPAPKRSQNTTWADFIRSQWAVMAGMDFFTVEVLSWRGQTHPTE